MTALHGFLGLPTDWDALLPPERFGEVAAPHWINAFSEPLTLPKLADQLNADKPVGPPDILVGYSMGGRIALHMLLQDPDLRRWKRAVIVSASPGISDPFERRKRLDQDRCWSERFRLEEWSSLITAWNCQPVFDGDPRMIRDERDFNRGELAEAMYRGSVGAQDDLRSQLSALKLPILWVAGERDLKYAALAKECAALNPRFRFEIVPNAGHRLPWSNTQGFQHALERFMHE